MSMDIGNTIEPGVAAAATAGAIQDTLGAQLIGKTLDKMNASGPSAQDYQFQKEVLQGAGIGNKLDATA